MQRIYLYSFLNDDAKVARAYVLGVYLCGMYFLSQGWKKNPALTIYQDISYYRTSLTFPISFVGVLFPISDLNLFLSLMVRNLHLTSVRRTELFYGGGF